MECWQRRAGGGGVGESLLQSCVCMYVRLCVFLCACLSLDVFVRTELSPVPEHGGPTCFALTFQRGFVCVYVYVYVYVCVCVCVCVCVAACVISQIEDKIASGHYDSLLSFWKDVSTMFENAKVRVVCVCVCV